MNKEQVYDQQIRPLVGKIYELCQQHGIEMFANFYLPSEENPALQCTTSVPDGDGLKNNGHMLALVIIAPNIEECDPVQPHELH